MMRQGQGKWKSWFRNCFQPGVSGGVVEDETEKGVIMTTWVEKDEERAPEASALSV